MSEAKKQIKHNKQQAGQMLSSFRPKVVQSKRGRAARFGTFGWIDGSGEEEHSRFVTTINKEED